MEWLAVCRFQQRWSTASYCLHELLAWRICTLHYVMEILTKFSLSLATSQSLNLKYKEVYSPPQPYSFLLHCLFNKLPSKSGKILTAPSLYSSFESSARPLRRNIKFDKFIEPFACIWNFFQYYLFMHREHVRFYLRCFSQFHANAMNAVKTHKKCFYMCTV